MLVRDWPDGCEVDSALIIRAVEARRRRAGEDYLRLELGDRSGSVTTMVSEPLPDVRELCRPGAVVWVRGHFAVHPRYGGQLELEPRGNLRVADPGEYAPELLLDGPPRTAGQMEADLRQLLATVQCQHLRGLLDVVFGEGSPLWVAYREAPAAKHYHQAYRHGLLEHSLSVAQAVSAISATFPGLDRDVAVAGALLHDIGKLEAYTTEGQSISMSDPGRLQGEIPLGYYRIRRVIEDLPRFPPRLAQAVLHIILSHHGRLEHGSPVVPCTREATLVHMMDNLGGRLGSFDRLEKELPAGATWSSFDRALGAGAWFAARDAA